MGGKRNTYPAEEAGRMAHKEFLQIRKMRERIIRNVREVDKLGTEAVRSVKEAVSPFFEAIKKEDDEND